MNASLRPRRLLRRHESFSLILQLIGNCVLISLLLFTCIFTKNQDVTYFYRGLLVNTLFLIIIFYPAFRVYQQSENFNSMVYRISIAWFVTAALVLTLTFLMFSAEADGKYSNEVLITWAVSVFIFQIPLLRLNYLFVSLYRKKHTKPINSIVVGLGKTAREFSDKINTNHWLPDSIIGMVEAYDNDISNDISEKLVFPCLGGLSNIKDIIKSNNIERIYIALPLKHSAKVEKINESLLDFQVDVIWIVDVSNWKLVNHSIREVAGFPILSLNESPINVSRVHIRIKHIIDKILALILIVIFSPLLVLIALAIKLTSKGPIIFSQERHGYNGEVICIAKFRSMVVHEDENVAQAKKDDKRVTKVGAFIRKCSLDELPQLFNVLQGTMSLVGPRPHAVKHNEYYAEKIKPYMVRHRIKPGITGLAQISGCRGETETTDKMEKRIEYDLAYINNWSLLLDFKILLKTPKSLVSKNIY